MFIQSVRIKPLSSKGQNSERGNTWWEKGPDGVHVSSTFFQFFLCSFFCEIRMIYYITEANSPRSVFPPIHDLNFRTVINYVHVW